MITIICSVISFVAGAIVWEVAIKKLVKKFFKQLGDE